MLKNEGSVLNCAEPFLFDVRNIIYNFMTTNNFWYSKVADYNIKELVELIEAIQAAISNETVSICFLIYILWDTFYYSLDSLWFALL